MATAPFNAFFDCRDAGGELTLIRPAPSYTEQILLAAAGAGGVQTLTVPAPQSSGDADVVVFAWSAGNIQVKPVISGGAAPANAPAGSTTDGSGWELNPQAYGIKRPFQPGATTPIGSFQIQTDTAGCLVTASFYTMRRNGT